MKKTSFTRPFLSQTEQTSNELCGSVAGMCFYGMCATALATAVIGIAGSVQGNYAVALTAAAALPVLGVLGYGLVKCTRHFLRQCRMQGHNL